jgi:hypothetical protein
MWTILGFLLVLDPHPMVILGWVKDHQAITLGRLLKHHHTMMLSCHSEFHDVPKLLVFTKFGWLREAHAE